jgi:3-methylfumaryl-CoA hydratase
LSEETTSSMSVEHSTRMAAAIDDPHPFSDGETLPLLWHWGHFTPRTPTSELGNDGHPILPDGPIRRFARRMWASGSVTASDGGVLVVGEQAVRRTTVIGSKESEGRSGPLHIVTLEHRYRQLGEDRIVEEQVLVYRMPGPNMPLPEGDWHGQVEAGQWTERLLPSAVTLFRFSAITFNSHRIHYDKPYATLEEGYPDLVVHGPYTALMIAQSIRRHFGRELRSFDFRASAPLFVDPPLTIIGTADGDRPSVQVIRNDGAEAVVASAELGGPALWP